MPHGNKLVRLITTKTKLLNIGFLFQSLNLENNKLKTLPNSIGSLKSLKTLNLSGNCLKVKYFVSI
jgi:Leucine-rich repeat (LRR) protein